MFGIGMGPSTQENQQFNNLSGVSSTAANMGLSDIGSSTDFMKAILSGDPAKIGQVLGPQIRAVKDQGQQQKQVNSQFSNRGGGTNASNQTIDDKTRSTIDDMISSITGSAASGLASTGTNLLSTGVGGFGTAFNEANTLQQQKSAQINDIFKSIADIGTGFVSGIGNLDRTGGSSFGEQVGNFFGV